MTKANQNTFKGLMKTIGLTKYECIIKLCLYRDKIEKILSLAEDKLPLYGADKERVQILLKDLKQGLKNDLDRCATGKGQRQVVNVEQDFYIPAILEAAKRISVDTNSTPSQKWIDEIDIAQKYIKFYLNQLLP